MEDLGGARRARLLPTEGRSAGSSTLMICISFLRAVVVVLVVSVIILIHFVVVIFSLRMCVFGAMPDAEFCQKRSL